MRGEPYQNLGFDPAGGYRDAGYMVSGQPVPSVASVQFLAGMNPDSTLALLGLSLANEALSFRRVDAQFEARYEVEIACYSGEEPVARLASEEAVRVATYVETQRRDESVVFQRFFNLPPGAVTATIVLTDRLSGDSTSITQQWRVPRLGVGSGEAALVMVYRGAMRRDATVGPELVVNPRAYAAYGLDTLAIYLEAYDNEAVASATVSISDGSGSLQWQDTVTLSHRGSGLSAGFVEIAPDQLSLGELTVEARLTDRALPVSSKAFVGLSSDWPVVRLPDVLSLLRHFGTEDSREGLVRAAPPQRWRRWREFWNETDPDPTTPGNEALYQYLNDVDTANENFAESGSPGWLTERGWVYLTLGKPDEMRELRDDPTAGGQKLIRWQYRKEDLTLYFVSGDGGFGYRLTPSSRLEYAVALDRKRDNEGG